MHRPIAAFVSCCLLLGGASYARQEEPGTTSARAAAQTARADGRVLPNREDSVKFAVIGDTGTGSRGQYDIAARMGQRRTTFPFEFVLMLGDNLYGGEDPADFVDKFERPYRPLLRAGVRFYATLGNHDEPSQRFYQPFNMNGRRFYAFEHGEVQFFALDSTYMTPAQVEWLRDALAKSDKRWKVAFFHHPIYSSGERHGSEMDLRVLLEPLFVEHAVNVVFAGHEHFYERLKPQNGVHYFIVGGSGKLRRGNLDDDSPMTAQGFDADNSFMVVEIAGDEMYFEAIARTGEVVDAGSIPRE